MIHDDVTRGWKLNAPFPATDRRTLQELNLPKENFLYLLTPEIPPILLNGEDKWAPNLKSCCQVIIFQWSTDPGGYEPQSHDHWRGSRQQDLQSHLPRISHSCTGGLAITSMQRKVDVILNQVKRDVATVTDIPVFRQSWTGALLMIIRYRSFKFKWSFSRLARGHKWRAVSNPDWSGDWLNSEGQPGEETRQTGASGETQGIVMIFDSSSQWSRL